MLHASKLDSDPVASLPGINDRSKSPTITNPRTAPDYNWLPLPVSLLLFRPLSFIAVNLVSAYPLPRLCQEAGYELPICVRLNNSTTSSMSNPIHPSHFFLALGRKKMRQLSVLHSEGLYTLKSCSSQKFGEFAPEHPQLTVSNLFLDVYVCGRLRHHSRYCLAMWVVG